MATKIEYYGAEALFQTRGRSKIMTAKNQSKKHLQKTEMERLKEENKYLK